MTRVRRPRLRLVLAVVNVILVALPLAGLAGLRIYDNALVRQTEGELVAQSAFVAAIFRDAWVEAIGERDAGTPGPAAASADREPWRPRPASIDLASAPMYPAPGEAPPGDEPEPFAAAAGARIATILAEAQRTTLAAIRVVDRNGVVVASTGSELGRSLTDLGEVTRALAGSGEARLRERVSDEPRPALSSISRGAGLRVFVSTPIVDAGEVIGAVLASRTPRRIDEVLYRKRFLIAGVGAGLIAAVLALALFTSLTVSRPIDALIDQAQRAVRGEQGAVQRLTHPVTREVEELSDAVATMAGTLEDRAEYIRTFASHVSHEFKSPLSAIQGAAELLEDHGETMTEAERRRFLDNIVTDTNRLSRLCGRLLELARADTAAVHDARARLGTVLTHLREDFADDDLNVTAHGDAEDSWATIDEATLVSVLESLVENARQHGATRIRLDAALDLDAGAARLGVADDGPGISKENAERVFEPFFTTARERGGTGLGLAVAARLLTAHGGGLRLRERDAPGAVFEAWIPFTRDGANDD